MSTATTPLESITIFFPFFNDAGTVVPQIELAFRIGKKVAKSLEVIAIHGGPSKDTTAAEINRAKKKFPALRVLDFPHNTKGYAVIQEGFKAATKEWVFYTDGDAQYDVTELQLLVKSQRTTQATVVNGYKANREDSWIRRTLGGTFQYLYRTLTHVPLQDIHCDFRVIKRSLIANHHWQSSGAQVISELMYTVQKNGAVFAEIPVKHYARTYGTSNYSWFKLTLESTKELLWRLTQA